MFFLFRTFNADALRKTFKLKLTKVDIPDGGKYKCEVVNHCGSTKITTVKIIVKGTYNPSVVEWECTKRLNMEITSSAMFTTI